MIGCTAALAETANIPGARYVELRTGYYMAVQTPELIADCIGEFLKSVGRLNQPPIPSILQQGPT